MRRLFTLLSLIALLWGGLHLAEGALPHDSHQTHQPATVIADIDAGDTRDPADQAAQANNHHCPLAADTCVSAGSDRTARIAPVIFTAPAVPLRAFSRAPPLQPPSA